VKKQERREAGKAKSRKDEEQEKLLFLFLAFPASCFPVAIRES
jgi:hypothetical protein